LVTTDAVKYGALSTKEGALGVTREKPLLDKGFGRVLMEGRRSDPDGEITRRRG
jgi:hypothetical protein